VKLSLFLTLPWLALGALYLFLSSDDSVQQRRISKLKEFRALIANQLGPGFMSGNFPEMAELEFSHGKELSTLKYSFDTELQQETQKLWKVYKPDYGAVVVMEAETGRILVLSSHEQNDQGNNWALKASFPAASTFKLVTAAASVEKLNFSPEVLLRFNGGNHTLYKRNVFDKNENRWTQKVTLKEAFARSINTVFGKLAVNDLEPGWLADYAMKFGFNRFWLSEIPFDTGYAAIPDNKDFHLAEISSGFNRITKMSPLQGALMASVVAANGQSFVPYIVDEVISQRGEPLFHAQPLSLGEVIAPETAKKLQVLMEETVRSGTSHGAFRALVRDPRFRNVKMGGKTGSLYNDKPYGKTDWFIGYAKPETGRTLVISALTVHADKWTVRSSELAKLILRKGMSIAYRHQNSKVAMTGQ
jgi:penicillin-binding protein A